MSPEKIAKMNWKIFKSRLKNRWSILKDEELDRYEGRFNQLAARIGSRVSEPRRIVQDYIDNLWFEIYVRNSKWQRSDLRNAYVFQGASSAEVSTAVH